MSFGEMDKGMKTQLREQLSGITEAKKPITKIGYWLDAEDNVKYVKYYSGTELLFTLTYSNAGVATSETWNVTRS